MNIPDRVHSIYTKLSWNIQMSFDLGSCFPSTKREA